MKKQAFAQAAIRRCAITWKGVVIRVRTWRYAICADAICANMVFALLTNQSNPHSLLAHTVRLRLCWPVVWGSCSPVIVQGA